MVDQVSAVKPFTTVVYTTKDGEHVSATKENGVVTLVGDKNGTRQMSLDDFKQELINNCAEIKLEKTPEKDTVEISKKPTDAPQKTTVATAKPAEEPKAEVGKKLDVAA